MSFQETLKELDKEYVNKASFCASNIAFRKEKFFCNWLNSKRKDPYLDTGASLDERSTKTLVGNPFTSQESLNIRRFNLYQNIVQRRISKMRHLF